jgi:ABC-2 type transport system ATP-binding protein
VGNKLELVIVGFGEEHRRLLESFAPQGAEVMDLNLEDAFIEYTRGPRRCVPIFLEETSHV